MILTAHQPVYLPWCGLFDKIARADVFVFFDQVQYQPRDYNNRNKIWTSHGPQWLTVPVFTKGHRNKTIDEIEINYQTPWQRKHWKSILQSYGKLPHFLPDFQSFYEIPWITLCDLNWNMLLYLLDALSIKTQIVKASAYEFHGTKSDLVLDMCKQLGASTYLFGAKGKDYAKVEDFQKAGIEPKFVEYHGRGENYSVIDSLFRYGHMA